MLQIKKLPGFPQPHSYLQDDSGDMQYSGQPERTEFHFTALRHGDYGTLRVVGRVVVCGCVSVR